MSEEALDVAQDAEADASVDQGLDAPLQSEEKPAEKKGGLAGMLAEEAEQDEAKPDAPENYDLNTHEFETFDVQSYSAVAKELGLSQDAAQKVIDSILPTMAEKHNALVEQKAKEFVAALNTQLEEDEEIGGANLEKNLKLAVNAVKKFGTPELEAILKNGAMSSHPEFVRFFARVGKSISEDSFVASGNTAPEVDLGKQMYKGLDKIFS